MTMSSRKTWSGKTARSYGRLAKERSGNVLAVVRAMSSGQPHPDRPSQSQPYSAAPRPWSPLERGDGLARQNIAALGQK